MNTNYGSFLDQRTAPRRAYPKPVSAPVSGYDPTDQNNPNQYRMAIANTNPRPQDMFGVMDSTPANALGTPAAGPSQAMVPFNTPSNPQAATRYGGVAVRKERPMAYNPAYTGGIGQQYTGGGGSAPLGNAVGAWTANNSPWRVGGGYGDSGTSANSAIAKYQQDLINANAANQTRYGQLLDLMRNSGNNQLNDQNTSYNALQGTLEGQRARQDEFLANRYGLSQDTLGGQRTGQLGFQDAQRARQMGYVDQFSNAEQERENRRLANAQSDSAASLQARGIRGTTVLDAINRNLIDDSALRSAELSDRTLGRRMGIEDTYTGRYGQTLGSLDSEQMGLLGQETGARYGSMAGMDQAQMGLGTMYGNTRNNTLGQLRGELANVIERRTDAPPDPNPMYAALNQPRGMAQVDASGYGAVGGGRYGRIMPPKQQGNQYDDQQDYQYPSQSDSLVTYDKYGRGTGHSYNAPGPYVNQQALQDQQKQQSQYNKWLLEQQRIAKQKQKQDEFNDQYGPGRYGAPAAREANPGQWRY